MNKFLFAALMILSVTGLVGFSSSLYAYEAVTVQNGGTVTGKIVFKGSSVPTRTVLPTKNKDVCGGLRREPLVEVGMDGGVKDAVVVLKDVTKGKAWDTSTDSYTINNEKCIFVPHVQIVPLSSDFTIVNSDPFLHNTHSFYDKKTAFNVALPFKGAELKRKLDKPGLVRVDCDVHGWMQAWIYVAENPYFQLTGEDGSFSITDVPPGDYTLFIWQEHNGEVEKQVSVKSGDTVDIGTIEIK